VLNPENMGFGKQAIAVPLIYAPAATQASICPPKSLLYSSSCRLKYSRRGYCDRYLHVVGSSNRQSVNKIA
jgi:hypothetical protein